MLFIRVSRVLLIPFWASGKNRNLRLAGTVIGVGMWRWILMTSRTVREINIVRVYALIFSTYFSEGLTLAAVAPVNSINRRYWRLNEPIRIRSRWMISLACFPFALAFVSMNRVGWNLIKFSKGYRCVSLGNFVQDIFSARLAAIDVKRRSIMRVERNGHHKSICGKRFGRIVYSKNVPPYTYTNVLYLYDVEWRRYRRLSFEG